GFYVYARRAFGRYPGFAAGWCDWLGNCASLAFMSTAFGEYAGKLIPRLAGDIKPVAIAILLVFSVLHWICLRPSGRGQEFTRLIKAGAFFAPIVACFSLCRKRSQAPRPH